MASKRKAVMVKSHLRKVRGSRNKVRVKAHMSVKWSRSGSRLWAKSKAKDKARRAKRKGWRIAKSGNQYYEARPDHSDLNPRTRL